MIRFVVVGTLSGALKRPRVLSHDNQAAALARYASDREQVTERVVWSKGGAPLVVPADYRPDRSELVPAVSLEVRRRVSGAPAELCEKWAKDRKRLGISKRI